MHSSKKRQVYVRGPNNVYRRKDHSGDSASDPVAVSSANELTALGFRLANPSLPLRDPHHQQSAHNHSLADLHFTSDTSLPETLSGSTSASNLLSPSLLPTDPVLRRASNISLMPANGFSFTPPGRETLSDKGIPFVLGMISMYVLQKSEPLISHYLGVLFGLLKVLLLWGVVSGAALWYSGKLSMDTIENLKSQALRSNFSLLALTAAAAAPETANPDVDVPSGASLPTRHRLPIRRGRRNLPTKSSFPENETHSEETNVRPFVTPLRRMITDPKLKLARDLTRAEDDARALKSGRSSPVRSNMVDHRRHSASSLDLTMKINKPLPPVQAETSRDAELPLVYEVKLRSLHDEEVGSSKPELLRLETIMSKKSVLGTRANYSKFLANVNDN